MKDVSPAATYAALLPTIVAAAREVGYALGPHGSFARDLDVIAVPWTDDAASPEALVMRLLACCGGRLRDGHRPAGKDDDGNTKWEKTRGDAPVMKPHGRMSWSIHLGDSGLYIDLSVMPRCRTVDLPEVTNA